SLNSVTGIGRPSRGNLPVPPSTLPWSAIADRRLHPLPQESGAHAHPDAKAGQPVAHIGTLAEPVRELRHQPHARRCEWMPAGDRAAVRVEARVLGIDAEGVAPAEHLNGERLVQLEEADVVECQA